MPIKKNGTVLKRSQAPNSIRCLAYIIASSQLAAQCELVWRLGNKLSVFTRREISVTLHCANHIFDSSGPIKANNTYLKRYRALIPIYCLGCIDELSQWAEGHKVFRSWGNKMSILVPVFRYLRPYTVLTISFVLLVLLRQIRQIWQGVGYRFPSIASVLSRSNTWWQWHSRTAHWERIYVWWVIGCYAIQFKGSSSLQLPCGTNSLCNTRHKRWTNRYK